MGDYAPPWDALQRDSLHPSHDVPLEQVRKSAATLASLLDEKKEEQVLKEACLGLCQLFGEGIQNDRIQAILEANVVPKLVSLLSPFKSRSVPTSVQLAALQVLGNVACGDDRQTQVVIDSDALPCLRALLSSSDRQIRKEVCWIVSNITESSHQVQDVLDADILPPLLKLLDNQDGACREDATWVLFNLSSNRDPKQISYLAEKNGVRALCNLLTCQKDLDVLWKGCGSVAAVALKGLRNILISGHLASSSDPNRCNKMVSLVAEAHGVERIEALTTHVSSDVRGRARLILERMFGAEPATADHSPLIPPTTVSALQSLATPPLPPLAIHASCSCEFPGTEPQLELPHESHHQLPSAAHYHGQDVYNVSGDLVAGSSSSLANAQIGHGDVNHAMHHIHPESDLIDLPGSRSGSSTDSDPEDEDSDSDLIPPPPKPCKCLLCTDSSPLPERRPRGRSSAVDIESSQKSGSSYVSVRPICGFCSGCGRLGDGRAGLAAKLGRAVRLGHSHCLALLLSRMTWSQRGAATEAPALLHPGGGPPDGGVGSSLPAVILAAQLGKPYCLGLLLARCRPDVDLTFGKKRLTALAWASHKGYLRCCQLLIEHGANPAAKCGDGVTALHLASSGGGHISICRLLIEHKAPVNSRSVKKQTPLCLAAQKGFSKVVQLLLDHGADPNNVDEGKYTPLHLAASNGYSQTVEILLRHGARAEAKTRNDVTPLHYAVQGGHTGVVSSLIRAGAKVNCNKKPLLLIAADDGKGDIVSILLGAGAAVDCRANIRATLDKDMEICDYLTPLHLAASKDHQEVVELLLRRDADVNERTSKSGWSPLDFAVLNGHSESAVILLKHGAVVSDTCKTLGRNNWTLVQYAASNGSKDVVRLLVQRLKEQRNSSSTNASSSAALHQAPAPSGGIAGSISQPQQANGRLTYDYHTCSACSKLRHSSCRVPSSQEFHGNVDPGVRDETRYDQRAIGPGETYGHSVMISGAATSGNEVKAVSSRRKVATDDRQNSLRAREIKKREAEALDARDRLEEAISQRSVPKLTEAISHVSKLVLHLATTVGSDGVSHHPDHTQTVDYSSHDESHGHAGFVHSPGQRSSTNASAPSLVPGPLAMEVGLGNEVQKARKILASLLAEEKRAREEKEREAMDSRRENAQHTVRKAITAALEGGDPRSLTRAMNRATRNILDTDNSVILRAVNVFSLISGMEKREEALRAAIHREDLPSLSESVFDAKRIFEDLKKEGGVGAANRIFHGRDASEALAEAGHALHALQEKRKREEVKELEAKNKEQKAHRKLKEAMSSEDVVRLESALNYALEALISKHSELASTVEIAKKVMTKRLKTERRKLRQARNYDDPLKIEEAASKAESFGLSALRQDIESAREQAEKLREQAGAVKELHAALSCSDVNALTFLRSKLNTLGMFTEAETARSELERLQRATRARALLESALRECKDRSDYMKLVLMASKPTEQVLERIASWTWPNVQRLRDLSNRTRQYGASQSALCEAADHLAKEITVLGRQVLELCIESNDARSIAAVITGYENTFINVPRSNEFGSHASKKITERAKEHLAYVQTMDQASIKAESAQVKVEYALATSRRSAARSRQGKSGHASRSIEDSTPRIASMNTASIESPVRTPSSVSSAYADDQFQPDTFAAVTCPVEHNRMEHGADVHRIDLSKKTQIGVHSCEDGCRSSHENSPAVVGECSHFYLFKEGNTVFCARCGNHRSSNNPEWLARVKRRGGKVQGDMATELSGAQDDLLSQGCQGNGISQHALRNGPSTTKDRVSPFDRNSTKSRQSLRTPTHLSLQQSIQSGISSAKDSSRGVRRSNARPDANVLMHILRQETSTETSKAGGTTPTRTTAEHIPVTSAPRMLLPSFYHPEVDRVNVYETGIQARGPLGMTCMYSSSDRAAVPPPLRGLQQAGAPGYGASCHTSSLDRHESLRTPPDEPLRSHIDVQDLLVRSAPSCDRHQTEGMDNGLARVAPAEDFGYSGRDLGLDFANENFGFDIDAIVDEPPPVSHSPGSGAEPGANGSASYVPSNSGQMNPNGFFRR